MEPSHLPQLNVVAALPRDAAIAAFREPPDTIGSPSSPPPPQTPQGTESQSGQLTKSIPITLAFPARPATAAVGPILAAALENRWESYREQLRRCQEKFSEGAVHELRVATRRLLAQFTLLSSVAPGAALEKGRRILKRRLAILGDLRDTQVQRLFIEQQTIRFPELLLLRDWLKRRERRLAQAAAEKVNRFKTRKLGRWISALIGHLTTNAGRSRTQSRLAIGVLRATANAFADAVDRRQAIDLADLRTIHQTRVAFKRFRYMLESLSPGITGLSKRQLRTLAYYQRKMGIIQDLEVMQACVARYTRGDKKREALLQRFSRHLRERRARALRSFLKSADRLYEFWPPPGLTAQDDSVPTRNAA
jgi:CHAD domain-containing protein